jgi:hypothetical protein
MKKQKTTVQIIIIFAVLASAGVAMTITAQIVPDPFAQQVLVSIGSGIFTAALAFFLVRFTQNQEE